jgi:hypothetical protein
LAGYSNAAIGVFLLSESISGHSTERLYLLQRYAKPRVGAPPHPARPWRVLGLPQLTIVAKLAPDFALGQRLSAVTASTLCPVSKAIG